MSIPPTDMRSLRCAMGCNGIEVESTKALEGALSGARAKDRLLVVGVRIDPSHYAAQF